MSIEIFEKRNREKTATELALKADLEKEQAVFSLSLAGKKLSLEVSQNQKNQSVLQQRGTLEKEQKNDKKWDRKFLIQKTAEFLRREIEK